MIPNKTSFQLDSGLIFTIKNAWVENNWEYDCSNYKAVIKKDSSFQFVIEATCNKENVYKYDYWLMKMDNSMGDGLGSRLDFEYSGQDTFKLILAKKVHIPLDTLIFLKKTAR